MTRKKRTDKKRREIGARHGWICHISGACIDPDVDDWRLNHVIPLGGGGSDDEDNLRPALAKAHLEKTRKDITRIAKGKRVRAKHLGTWQQGRRKKKIPSRPMDGTRKSGRRRRMNGTVERW